MKQKLFYFLGTLSLIFGLAGCATTDLNVDYDQNTDFSHYRNYAWLPEAAPGPNLTFAQNDLIDARVKQSVNQELAAKGYQLAAEKDADFFVTYHNVFEKKMDVQTIGYYRYGPGYYWHTHCIRGRGHRGYTWAEPYYVEPRTYVTYYTEGTLVMDMIDRNSQKLVWRGTSVRVVNEKNSEELSRKIEESVSRLLEKFPPPAGVRKNIPVVQNARKIS